MVHGTFTKNFHGIEPRYIFDAVVLFVQGSAVAPYQPAALRPTLSLCFVQTLGRRGIPFRRLSDLITLVMNWFIIVSTVACYAVAISLALMQPTNPSTHEPIVSLLRTICLVLALWFLGAGCLYDGDCGRLQHGPQPVDCVAIILFSQYSCLHQFSCRMHRQ